LYYNGQSGGWHPPDTQLDSPPRPESRPAKDVSDSGLFACTRRHGERGGDGPNLSRS
jgi:hypothetical protein